MRKFNQSIYISIEVDAIAQQLLDTMAPDFKHRETVVEAIIGHNKDNSYKIGSIFQALNGYVKTINFSIDENVIYETSIRYTENGDLKTDYHTVKDAVVKDINLFGQHEPELLLSYDYVDYANGKEVAKEHRVWVGISNVTKLAMS